MATANSANIWVTLQQGTPFVRTTDIQLTLAVTVQLVAP